MDYINQLSKICWLISVRHFHRYTLLANLVRLKSVKVLASEQQQALCKILFRRTRAPRGQILINDEERDAFCIATSYAHVLLIALRWPYSITSRKKRNYAKACIVARISTLCLGSEAGAYRVRLLRVLFTESRMSCGLNDIFIPWQGKKACTSNTRRKK